MIILTKKIILIQMIKKVYIYQENNYKIYNIIICYKYKSVKDENK